MQLSTLEFTAVDWPAMEGQDFPGQSGRATWRTLIRGSLRVRMVDYSSGYVADHWCDKGHVALLLEGDLQVRLADGRYFDFLPGQSFLVSDLGDAAHMLVSKMGARLFIVDSVPVAARGIQHAG